MIQIQTTGSLFRYQKKIENPPSELIFVSKILPKTKFLIQSCTKSSPEDPKSSSEYTEGALRRLFGARKSSPELPAPPPGSQMGAPGTFKNLCFP